MSRLLPGDPAPVLPLDLAFNRDALPEIVFDRTSVVILWNGGCGYCHSLLESVSEFETKYGVPCFGIAIMVLNVEATRSIARSLETKVVLALEAIPTKREGLSRGSVTRHWFEPSGCLGLPAVFIVDQTGAIAWIGHEAIEERLNDVLRGDWNIQLARDRWRESISDQQILHASMIKDVLNALIVEGVAPARQLVNVYDQEQPELAENAQYNGLKLDVFASDPNHRNIAADHYRKCVDGFKTDHAFHLQLADSAVRFFSQDHSILQMSLERLNEMAFEREAGNGRETQVLFELGMYVCVAKTCHLLGRKAEARDAANRVVTMSRKPGISDEDADFLREEVKHIVLDKTDV